MDQIVLGPEPKNLDARSWSPKFKFRLHSPDCNLAPAMIDLCFFLKIYECLV